MLSQFSPMTETLIDLAPATGEYTANLSTSWEMSPRWQELDPESAGRRAFPLRVW